MNLISKLKQVCGEPVFVQRSCGVCGCLRIHGGAPGGLETVEEES